MYTGIHKKFASDFASALHPYGQWSKRWKFVDKNRLIYHKLQSLAPRTSVGSLNKIFFSSNTENLHFTASLNAYKNFNRGHI